MANKLYDEASVQAIANAIRSKNKTETKYKISQMAQAIEDIPSIIKRVMGNPIEFSDGADAPLVKCTTAIQGNQDLHGYDKPWVGGAGKNKLPLVLADIKSANTSGTWNGNAYTLNGVTFTVETDGDDNVTGIKANGTSTADWVLLNIPTFTLTAGNYILNGSTNGELATYRIDMTPSGTTNLNGDTAFNVSEDSQFSVRCIIRQSGYTANNVMFYPMIRLSTVSDPTFAPYSNICPITACTDGEIVVRGKNLINPQNVLPGSAYLTYDPTTEIFEVVNTGDVKIFTYTFKANVRYTIGAFLVSGTVKPCIIVRNTDGTTTGQQTNYVDTTKPLSFIFTQDTTWNVRMQSAGGSSSQSAGTKYKLMMIVGSSTNMPTTYSPYTSTTHETTYPSAIYRGSEDCVEGTAVCEKKKIIISSGIQLYGNYGVDNAPLFYWNQSLSDIAPYSETASPSQNKPICNVYEAITQSNQYNMKDFEFRTNSSLATSNRFYFRDSRFSTAEEFNAYIANNPIEIAYPLATPTTSSVTPTNLPLKSLFGYNHIESSTGEMTVDYITDAYQNFVDTVESALPNTRNLLTASKGGTKAMDIFLSLDTFDKETTSSENIEIEEDNSSETNDSEDNSENIEETR